MSSIVAYPLITDLKYSVDVRCIVDAATLAEIREILHELQSKYPLSIDPDDLGDCE